MLFHHNYTSDNFALIFVVLIRLCTGFSKIIALEEYIRCIQRGRVAGLRLKFETLNLSITRDDTQSGNMN
jgi:hypothetical protein